MRCIEPAAPATGRSIGQPLDPRHEPTRRWLMLMTAVAAGTPLALVGCGSAPTRPAAPAPTPAPAPAPAAAAPRPAPAESPAPAPSAAGRSGLPEPVAARSWDDFRRQAARRLVAAHPDGSYMGKPPEILFGIPVIETELYVDGTIKSITVMRQPADERARDTVKLAMDAIRRAAPYGDMSRLPRPWKWVEVFLFNDKRQFKPRTLDN